ncbi:3-deoxy-manno-octulosonate cytidylyltransferase (CMP-KDO synthetase) [Draconibacterium orientale]|uniref:3-deoxy-manno-octulosonate cytidylyltransferase n=1 Tax=Draconibacterium orientale TaxID=1168034 RepID=X5DY71_9BACT|nr:3-deoxy-manno-octulosonate cytidylyltransferase [Draconibacterium orientale]AHW59226.1 3-deoxy-manno-octulosonate cytidylyltransferase [Draconibacterium orientale]SET23304.1 3-deoxy-manno-octulosonate cytidylyltransferase (CMP-KDO synthetase) [Draconibacterium orientale]
MNFIGIIPARYQSSRFPGKPLAKIKNKPMIQWVYENASKALPYVCVATDDDRIFDAVKAFGGEVVKTLPTHQSGTDRCAEAALKIAKNRPVDIVVNIQGDEPFVKPEQIELIKLCFESETEIATLVKKIDSEEELFNPNRPKVVLDKNDSALYFSRSPIPYFRGEENKNWVKKHTFWSHIGMYAFKADVLQKITQLEQGKLELAESLEQLRWLENGYKIKTAETTSATIGIDTPGDLEAALQLF